MADPEGAGSQERSKKVRKTEGHQPWRMAESIIRAVPEVDIEQSKVEIESVLTDEKELKMWWYDALEKKKEGSVYIFGKVLC
jgi:hypothetical protein